MISIIQCHGCVHLSFDYKTGGSSVAHPCHGCYVTTSTSGRPSNYQPQHYTVTSIVDRSHMEGK